MGQYLADTQEEKTHFSLLSCISLSSLHPVSSQPLLWHFLIQSSITLTFNLSVSFGSFCFHPSSFFLLCRILLFYFLSHFISCHHVSEFISLSFSKMQYFSPCHRLLCSKPFSLPHPFHILSPFFSHSLSSIFSHLSPSSLSSPFLPLLHLSSSIALSLSSS